MAGHQLKAKTIFFVLPIAFIRHFSGLYYGSKLNHFVIKVSVAHECCDSAILNAIYNMKLTR